MELPPTSSPTKSGMAMKLAHLARDRSRATSVALAAIRALFYDVAVERSGVAELREPRMVASSFLRQRGGHYLLLCAAAGLLFFWNLGGPTLWDLDEGRNATAAWEMYAANNWVVPTFNGTLRIDK